MTELINGKEIATAREESLKEYIEKKRRFGPWKTAHIQLALAVLTVGDDDASKVYVRNKVKAGERLGIRVEVFNMPTTVRPIEIARRIADLNINDKFAGIILQLPLPPSLQAWEQILIDCIAPEKDVDGLTTANKGRLFINPNVPDLLVPCTPQAVMTCLRYTGLEITGYHAVIIGRSNLVGKPLSQLLLARNCSVTVCHSRSIFLENITRSADIIISAVGRPEMFGTRYFGGCAAIIDVGINRDQNGKLVGDIARSVFDSNKASYMTPVPGGVGPLTVYHLMENTVKAWEFGNIRYNPLKIPTTNIRTELFKEGINNGSST